MGDAWEDEGYAGEDDWGEESIEADLEEELLLTDPGELDDLGLDDELGDDSIDLDAIE